MAPEERERMNVLIQRIQQEQDPKIFAQLVEQLNELLERDQNRVKGASVGLRNPPEASCV